MKWMVSKLWYGVANMTKLHGSWKTIRYCFGGQNYMNYCVHTNQVDCNQLTRLHRALWDISACQKNRYTAYIFTVLRVKLWLLLINLTDRAFYLTPRGTMIRWGRKNGRIFQKTFSNAFSWVKMYKFCSKRPEKLFPDCPIDNIPGLLEISGLVPTRRQAIIRTNDG